MGWDEKFFFKTFFSISNDRRSGRLLIIAHSSSYGIMIGERRFPILSLIGYSPRPAATTPTEAELTIMKTMPVSGSKPPGGGVLGIKAGGCHWCGCCVAGWWRGAVGCRDDFMGQGHVTQMGVLEHQISWWGAHQICLPLYCVCL